MTRVKSIIAHGEKLRQRGHNPLMLWSLSNKDHPLSAEQLKARKYIIDNETIPDEYDIFLFNATAETSINLNTPIDFFIAHNPDETTITQSRGRYRVDIDTLYVQDTKAFEPIPESYLNRPVNRTELKELRAFLHMKKDNGKHEIKVDDMLREFSKHGYNVESGMRNRRQCFIIRKK